MIVIPNFRIHLTSRYEKFNLFGKIYVPTTHPNFKPPEKWNEGIKFSSSAKFHVDVITTGEK